MSRRAIHDIKLLELADSPEGERLMEAIDAVDSSLNEKPSADFNARLCTAANFQRIKEEQVSSTFNERLRARWLSEGSLSLSLSLGPKANWLWRTSAAMAACGLCIVAILAAMVHRSEPASISLVETRQLVAELRSIHIKGMVHAPDAKDPTTLRWQEAECYAGRPRLYWQRTTNGYHGTDGSRYVSVNEPDNKADAGQDVPLRAQWQVESFFERLPDMLTGPSSARFRQLSRETIDGVDTQIYERIAVQEDGHTARYVIWLDPAAGMPVKIKIFDRDEQESEKLRAIYDTIRPNAPLPRRMFPLRAPENISQRQYNHTARNLLARRAGELSIRLAFSINRQALLTCWSYADSQVPDPPLTVVTADGGEHVSLATYSGPAGTWRWTLSIPDDGSLLPNVAYRYAVDDMAADLRPLKPDAVLLNAMLTEAQLMSRDHQPPHLTASQVYQAIAAHVSRQ